MDNVWLNPDFSGSNSNVAIFADRDGTLIKHVDYISDPEQVKLLPGVKEAVHKIFERGIPFYILTNQSGVGRGYFPIEQVYACQRKLFELLEISPDQLAGWCIAPEAPGTEGGYRKPSPRFIEEACSLTGIAQSHCHVIGDTLVDLETAWHADAQAWAVSCGKPELPRMIQSEALSGAHTLEGSFPNCVERIIEAQSDAS